MWNERTVSGGADDLRRARLHPRGHRGLPRHRLRRRGPRRQQQRPGGHRRRRSRRPRPARSSSPSRATATRSAAGSPRPTASSSSSPSPTGRSCPGPGEAPRLQQRVRRCPRHPHHPRADLGGGEHGLRLKWGNWAVAKLVEFLLQHQPPERHRLHVPALRQAARRSPRREHARRRQPRRAGDADADDHLGRPLRRDPRELPAAGRHVLRDRRPDEDGGAGPADDRADPPVSREAPVRLPRPEAFKEPVRN